MAVDNPYSSPTDAPAPPREVPTLEPPQSVTYQISQDEAKEVAWHLSRLNPFYYRRTRRRQLWFVGFAIVFAGVAAYFYLKNIGMDLLSYLFLFYAVFLLYAAYRLPSRARKATVRLTLEAQSQDRNSWIDNSMKVTLQDEGLRIDNDNGYQFRKWSRLDEVEVTETMLYLHFSHFTGLPIPSRAFYDEAAYEAFCDLAKRLWIAANRDPRDLPPASD